MRFKNVLILGLILIMVFSLAACGGSQNTGSTSSGSSNTGSSNSGSSGSSSSASAPQQTHNLTMSLGGTSGTFYIQGAALAEYINKNTKTLRIVPSISGGGVENTRKIGGGQAEIGMAFVGDLYNAWQGEEPFENELKDFRQLGPAQETTGWNFMVLESSGINTLEDLIGKSFSPGAPGSGSANGAAVLFQDLGLYDQINISYNAWGELPGMLKDNTIQGFNRTGGVPIPVAQEIDLTHPMKILDLKPYLEQVNFFEKYPYYVEFKIPAGAYKGQKEDALTFGQPVVWLAHKDVPEEAIYEFMKLSYTQEAADHMATVYPDHSHLNAEPLANSIVPLHPGAQKFWEEKGTNIPEPLLK